jgi:hypothetical protein
MCSCVITSSLEESDDMGHLCHELYLVRTGTGAPCLVKVTSSVPEQLPVEYSDVLSSFAVTAHALIPSWGIH